MKTARPRIPDDIRERFEAINTCEFARLTGMEIMQVGGDDGEVRITMDGQGKGNGLGTVHGGAIFALADQAFGVAANCDGISQVAVSACIKYLAPAIGSLEAVARKVDDNDQTSVYRVWIFAGERLVAVFQGTGYKVGGFPDRSS